jgi:hypothetical protein
VVVWESRFNTATLYTPPSNAKSVQSLQESPNRSSYFLPTKGCIPALG